MSHLSGVIILTTGSSGSSVLAGTIAAKGFWVGRETKKLNFDTYENARLVDLNVEILKAAGFQRYDCNDLPSPEVARIRSLAKSPLSSVCKDFIAECDAHRPWLWKDPRLSYTIHLWGHFLHLERIKFVFIERDMKQSYAGLILSRRVPMSYAQHNMINQNYKNSVLSFFETHSVPFLMLEFEELLLKPESTLPRVSLFLESNITVEDLRGVYKGPLYRVRYTKRDWYEALLRYYLYRYVKRDYIRFPRGAIP